MLLLRMPCFMQDAQKVALPESPKGQPSSSAAIAGPTWSDFQKLYHDVMTLVFFLDPAMRQVVGRKLQYEKTVARLSDRLQNETDKDFIDFTLQKIEDASTQLRMLGDEFEGSHVGDIHTRFNEFSSLFSGPQLQVELI